mmetsp:Transcript_4497/g.10412  ORF Transcript_4497/g.10412 Transcript_4497/m.10412 type:complete len:226 (-) Transcript_4497:872-1549(-)
MRSLRRISRVLVGCWTRASGTAAGVSTCTWQPDDSHRGLTRITARRWICSNGPARSTRKPPCRCWSWPTSNSTSETTTAQGVCCWVRCSSMRVTVVRMRCWGGWRGRGGSRQRPSGGSQRAHESTRTTSHSGRASLWPTRHSGTSMRRGTSCARPQACPHSAITHGFTRHGGLLRAVTATLFEQSSCSTGRSSSTPHEGLRGIRGPSCVSSWVSTAVPVCCTPMV